MKTSLKVYLFPDISQFILNNYKVIEDIERDNHVIINHTKKSNQTYFKIVGEFENIHKSRIILQDLEKEIYRDSYLSKPSNS